MSVGGMYDGPGGIKLYGDGREVTPISGCGVNRTRSERMKNEFCVVVRDTDGVPHYVSAVHSEDEAKKLRNLLTEGEVVPAEEGRRYKDQILQQPKSA